MTSGGIGSVSVHVVPDANDFWRRFEATTRPGAENAGRQAGQSVRRGMQTELDRPVNVRVNANTNDVQRATQQTNLLRDALVFLGPAAVPVGATLAGAFAGAIPVAATLALGIKGISNELKAGQLVGTKYAADFAQIKTEVTTLQATAAAGLLPGIDAALKSSTPLFKELNADVGVMSVQLGQIVAGAAPALLSILNALNPLFVTFGNLVAQGAQKLEHFATSGTGLQTFVSYVQRELPAVLHTLGQLVELAGRLIVSLAPLGHVIVEALGGLASALNSIPLNVLTALSTGAIAAYAAFRTYGAISGIVDKVSAGFAGMAARSAAAAAVQNASALAVEAAVQQEAAAVAVAQADMAAAAAAGAAEIAAATAGTSSVLAEGAAAAAVAAAEEAAAFQAAADAAIASAAETAAAAEAAAAAVSESGAAASAGFAGLLGPIGAVIVGVGILGATLLGTSGDTSEAAKAQDSYAESLKKTTDALAGVNIAATNKNLADAHAFQLLDGLKSRNSDLTLTYRDLALGVNGSEEQFKKVEDALRGNGIAGEALARQIATLRGGLDAQTRTQIALNEANKQAQTILNGGSVATQRQAAALHTTAAAYLAAQQAAQQNVEKTREQTVQFQLENDAASLLSQTLDKLSGKNLGYAQSLNSFQQTLVTLASNLQSGNTAVTGLSQAAIANRGALLSGVTAAEQAAEAYGKMTGSSTQARSKLIELRQQLIDNAVAHGEDREAVTAYIDSVLKIPASVPPTAIDVKTQQATAKVDALKARINAIKQGRVPGVDVNSREAQGLIRQLQAQIDRLTGKHVVFTVDANLSPAMQAAIAFAHNPANVNSQPTSRVYTQAGGTRATFGQGQVPPNTVSTVGEGADHTWEALITDSQGRATILSNSQAKAAGFKTPTRYAGGSGASIVTLDPYTGQTVGSGSNVVSLDPKKTSSTHTVHVVYVVEGKQFASYAAASNAAISKYRADVKLGVKIDTKDLAALKNSLSGTASQVNAAFQTALGDARGLGLGSGMAKHLQDENKTLTKLVNDRNKTADALAAVRQKFTDEKNTVKAAITGSFDITTAGHGFDGNQPVTGANILAQQTQAANRVRTFVKDLEKARAKGISKTYLQQLAEKGPDALPEVEAILTLSKSQIGQLDSTSAAIYNQGDQLGKFVGGQMYGANIASLSARERADEKLVERLGSHIAAEFKSIVADLADRPIVIKVNDREIARATSSGVNRNARRK